MTIHQVERSVLKKPSQNLRASTGPLSNIEGATGMSAFSDHRVATDGPHPGVRP